MTTESYNLRIWGLTSFLEAVEDEVYIYICHRLQTILETDTNFVDCQIGFQGQRRTEKIYSNNNSVIYLMLYSSSSNRQIVSAEPYLIIISKFVYQPYVTLLFDSLFIFM